MANKHSQEEIPQEQQAPEEELPRAGEPEAQAEPEAETAPAPEKSEVEQLNEQIEGLNDRLLRTMAEYDNFRKRSQREKEAIYPQATASTVAQFVPILDTFDRALSAPCGDPDFKKGVEMILQNFMGVLQKLGVEEFGAPGEQFNPDFHNAVMHVEDEELDQNVIVDVFQKGYKIGDRIVRHAMVKVAN